MNKIKYIILAALLMGAAACEKQSFQEEAAFPADVLPEGGKVELTFSVPVPETTRAMAEDPDITSMHVLVFSSSGIFLEAAQATLVGTVGNGSTNTANYSVELTMGSAERRLHFIANLPSTTDEGGNVSYNLPTSGSENTVLRSLTTTGGATAYWQRIVLPKGILPYKYDGSGSFSYFDVNSGTVKTVAVSQATVSRPETYNEEDGSYTDLGGLKVSKNDFITKTGQKVTSSNGFFASTETREAAALIPLIRNFARIQVKDSWGDFVIEQAALVYTPVSGYVAPYDDSAGHGYFVEAYTAAGSTPLNSTTIENSGYQAMIPMVQEEDAVVNGVSITAPSASDYETLSNGEAILYMYERGIPEDNATCILISGHYTSSPSETKWFKFELADEEGAYLPIYRDFTYVLDITGIEGSGGYDTAQEALENSAIGDVCASTQTKTLTEVSDGRSLTMKVQYIDYVHIGEADEVTFLYKLEYSGTKNGSTVTESLRPALTIKTDEGVDAAITGVDTSNSSLQTGPDGESNWYLATVSLAGFGDTKKISTLHVEGSISTSEGYPYNKTMYRDVTFKVMKEQEYRTLTTSVRTSDDDKYLTLVISLPNDLSVSMFPLILQIESSANNINPNVSQNMPASFGDSYFTPGTNHLFFLKTIDYSDYKNGTRNYTAVFKITDVSVTQFQIAVTNKYFKNEVRTVTL